ncbi:MAG: hypothetical protein ACFCBU_09170 [Cyanophyceae cyanobacterium]
MAICGVKRGRTIELSEPLKMADGQVVEITDIKVVPPFDSLTFWDALQGWRSQVDWENWGDADPWAEVRDRHPGRELGSDAM